MESKGPPLRLEALEAYLDEGLEHETQVVELLVVAQARGQANLELWDKLLSAALRDDRLVELAAVFEKLATDRRVKIMPPPAQAQIFLNTAKFFMRALGDIDAAERSLERVLALVPGHPDAFEQLRKILLEKDDTPRLIALHLSAVGPKTEKESALEHLRAALSLAERAEDPAEAARVATMLLKLEPGSEHALAAICASLESAKKFPELARALEQLLAADPPVSDERRSDARARLIELYDDKLPDVEKAVPHVEEVLAKDPTHAGARRVATRLLGIKSVAARAAHALEAVYEAEGDHAAVTQMLGIQIEQLRGPKKAEAQKKLGALLWDVGDDAAAFSQYEAVIAVDQSDDEVRIRYVELARRLGKQGDASKMLTRAAAAVKDPSARGRINLESARLLAEAGDPKRARLILQTVLDQAESEVALEAARVMREISPDAKALAPVLEALARLSNDNDEKLSALTQLAELYEGDLKDTSLAIQARTRILTLDPSRDSADLERLLETRGEYDRLVEVLEARASGMGIDDERRELLVRAALLHIERTNNAPEARRILDSLLALHGPSREVHALLLPLLTEPAFLEQRTAVLTAELELVPDDERVAVSAELAAALLGSGKTELALGAFAEVLGLDPSEPVARRELLELAQSGQPEHKLRAASVLAPILRVEGHEDLAALLRVIATESSDAEVRVEALEELYYLLAPDDAVARLKLAAKGLSEVLALDPARAGAWATRVEAQHEAPPVAIAMALAAPIDTLQLTPGPVAELAERAAEALAAAGRSDAAIALFRRVLEVKSEDDTIVHRIDELLEKACKPQERVALFRAALERNGTPERNRDLYLSIGAIQLEQLNDGEAATATFRQGLQALAHDTTLTLALCEALETTGRFTELAEELEKERAHAATPREGAELDLKIAEVSRRGNDLEVAARHYKSALAVMEFSVTDDLLDPIEELARLTVDVGLLIIVGERRVGIANSAAARYRALAHLGGLFGERGGDPVRAAESFGKAAEEARRAELFKEAAEAFERVLAYQPENRVALGALVELNAKAGDGSRLLALTKQLVNLSETREEAAAAIDRLRGGTVAPEDVLGLLDQSESRFGTSPEIGLIRADVLVQTNRESEAVDILLGLADDLEAGSRALALLDEVFAASAVDPRLIASKRKWLDHRIRSASSGELRERLFELFRFERDVAKDQAKAEAVLERLLELDPDDDAALVVRFEFARDAGDWDQAQTTLSRRVDVAVSDEERTARSLELAEYLSQRSDGILRALFVLEPLLSSHGEHPVFRKVAALALANEDAADRAVEMLSAVADSLLDVDARAAIYEQLFDHAPKAALGEQAAKLFEAWLVCLAETDPKALMVAARAATAVPENDAFWDRVEELARNQKAPQAVVDAYKQTLASGDTLDPEVALRVGERGVAFQEEWFDDQEALVQMLRRIVTLAPTATWAFERLKLIYNAAERWAELFDLYDEVIRGQLDAESKIMIIEDAVEVAKDLVGDADRAIHYLEQLRTFRPSDAKLASSLERLYERHHKSRALITLLMSRLPQLAEAEVGPTRLRIAGLWDTLDDRESALDALAPLIAAGDAEAVALVVGWLEQVAPASTTIPRYVRFSRALPQQSSFRRRAAALLAPTFKSGGELAKLATTIQVGLEAELPLPQRLVDLRELETVAVDLKDHQLVLDAGLASLQLTPEGPDAELVIDTCSVNIAGERDKVVLLVDALLKMASEAAERPRALFLLTQGAKIAREELKDEGRSVTFELAILSRSEGDPSAALAAAKKLDHDLAAMGREAERCAVLEQLGKLALEPSEKRQSLLEAARIADEVIGDRARSLVSLRAWLAVDPKDLEVLSKLIEQLRTMGEFSALADALGERVPLLSDASAKTKDQIELAAIVRKELGDRSRAVHAYRSATVLAPERTDLVDELLSLLREEERFDEFAELVESEVVARKDPSRRATLLAQVGDIERKVGHVEKALSCYSRALAEEPSLASAQSGLETLVGAMSPSEPSFATGVGVLAKSFESAGQLDRWLSLVPARLLCMTNDLEKCEVLLNAARLEEEVQSNPVRALERTLAAFVLRPAFPGAAERLLERAKKTERWDLVAPQLLPALETRDHVPRGIATELLISAAEWLSGHTPNVAGIENLLRTAHATEPGDADILLKLVAHRRATPGASLVEALLTLAELEPDSLEPLEEAVTVSLRELADSERAVGIATKLRERAVLKLKLGADSAAEDKALWALEVEADALRKRGDSSSLRRHLLELADLPVTASHCRSLLLSAAELSTSEEKATLFERVYAADPSDAMAFEELSALYLELDRKPDLARLRSRMAEASTDGAERARLRLSAAELQAELGARDAAISTVKSTLLELPGHEPSIRLLTSLLTAKDAISELTGHLESSANTVASNNRGFAISLFEQAATLAETRLKDATRAVRSVEKLVELEPTAERLDRLATLFQKAAQPRDEATALERLIEIAGPSDELSLRLATAYGKAGFVERAREQLEQAVSEGRGSPRVREVLAEIYRSAGAHAPLAELLEAEANEATDVAIKVDKLRSAANLHVHELNDPARAAELLEAAIAAKPDDLQTLFALADLRRIEGNVPRAREVLAKILAEFGTRKPKERALVHFELAKLALGAGDRTQALSELDAASKVDPTHAGVLSLLGEVSLLEGQYLRANRTYRGLLLVLRSHKGDKPKDALTSKARVLVELAFVAENQREPERKAEFIESALTTAREDASEFEPLLAALEKRGYTEFYAGAIEECLKSGELSEERRLSLRIEHAVLLGRKLGRVDDGAALALECLAELLAAPEVNSGQAMPTLLSLLAELGRLADVYAKLMSVAKESHGATRVEFVQQALQLAENDMKDPEKTSEALEELLLAWDDSGEGSSLDRRSALSKLDRLLAPNNGSQAGALRHVRVLTRLVELSSGDGETFTEYGPTLYRLLAIHLREADFDEVYDVLDRARSEDPDGDRFERELRAVLALNAGEARFIRLLEDFGRDRGRRQATIDALLMTAETSADPSLCYKEAYELSTELEDAAQSERLLRKLVPASKDDDSAEDAWALSALADLRFGASDAKGAADLWERAAAVSEPVEERALIMRVADLADRVLGDSARAIVLFESLRKREPADRELWHPLADLFQRAGDTEAFAALMDETIPLVDDLSERTALRVALGAMLESKDVERAASVLAEAIDDEPNNVEAASHLERIYNKLGHHEQLAILLERQLDAAKDASDKARVVSLSNRIGELREKSGDVDAALDAFHGALDWDEDNLEALRAAVRLHTEREDSVVLGDLLDRLLLREQGDEAVRLALRVADMKLASGDPVGAERALTAGYKSNGRNIELKQRLTNLYTERGDRLGLARLSAGEAQFIQDPKAKKELLLAAAETVKADGDPREAADLYADAFDVDPDDRDTLFALMDACATTSQHARAISAVDRALATDSKDAWLLFSRAVLREAVGESDAALDDLEAAYQHSEGQYAAELRAHLEAALSRITTDPSASRRSEGELRRKLAEVLAASGDPGAARTVLDTELARDPQNPELLATLAQIEESAGRDDAAATAYARACAIASGTALSRIALRLFECTVRLGRPSLARPGLERALGSDPNDEAVRAALRAVYEETGAIAELADLVVAEAHCLEDESARLERLLEAARLLLYSTGDDGTVTVAAAERASRVLEEAKLIQQESQDVQQLLAEAFAVLGRGDEAREIMAAVIASHKSKRSRELGQAYYALYRVEAKGGNLSDAIEALGKAFDNQPQNGSLALELGLLAVDLDEQDIAQRAFRAVTLLKPDGSISTRDRAIAYFHLGSIAVKAGDARRAKLMLEKSLAEDSSLIEARDLIARLG